MNTLLTNSSNIPTFTKLVQGQLALMLHYPKLIDNLTEPCCIVYCIVLDTAEILYNPNRSHQDYIEASKRIIVLGYQFYKAMSVRTQVSFSNYIIYNRCTLDLNNLVNIIQDLQTMIGQLVGSEYSCITSNKVESKLNA